MKKKTKNMIFIPFRGQEFWSSHTRTLCPEYVIVCISNTYDYSHDYLTWFMSVMYDDIGMEKMYIGNRYHTLNWI